MPKKRAKTPHKSAQEPRAKKSQQKSKTQRRLRPTTAILEAKRSWQFIAINKSIESNSSKSSSFSFVLFVLLCVFYLSFFLFVVLFFFFSRESIQCLSKYVYSLSLLFFSSSQFNVLIKNDQAVSQALQHGPTAWTASTPTQTSHLQSMYESCFKSSHLDQ